ncbi:SMR family transporter [Helicobacter sp. 11S03491-1]|uniref:SMR family transporter n=1 Tax=Helicobacter sp. 11S03491-1 TaxID=1476196 RepID=UPI00215168E0|nr:SMR family transporter [Helicobacter sp. 11S03491-1]
MYFVFIVFAAFLDVIANLMLKKSEGFSHKFLGIGSIILVLCAFISLSIALKEVSLSIAYCVWGTIGIIGTVFGGYLFFGERLKLIGWVGVIFVVVSVVLLSAF